MRLRRCHALLIEPRERLSLSLDDLLAGGAGLGRETRTLALAAHLDRPVPVTRAQLDVLASVSPSSWIDAADLAHRCGTRTLAALVARGLLIAERGEPASHRRADERVRANHWHAASAVLHRHTRWSGVDSGRTADDAGMTLSGPRAPPGRPPLAVQPLPGAARLVLPRAAQDPLLALLQARHTCRNFDRRARLPATALAGALWATFGACQVHRYKPGFEILKKGSPSGGGLHPVEAHLVVRRVGEVPAGLYRYHPVRHALERWPRQPATGAPLLALARRAVAGQRYFADAAALVVLSARVRRSQWKYRNHAKAYRVMTLDAGHLAQTFQLAATGLGLGCFVTAAINESAIEQAFGFDPMEQAVIAVLGVGIRDASSNTFELGPVRTDGDVGTAVRRRSPTGAGKRG